jgi:hypothetical protein
MSEFGQRIVVLFPPPFWRSILAWSGKMKVGSVALLRAIRQPQVPPRPLRPEFRLDASAFAQSFNLPAQSFKYSAQSFKFFEGFLPGWLPIWRSSRRQSECLFR